MQCPECGRTSTAVTDTRNYAAYKRRRRECTNCKTRWTTYEVSTEMFKSCRNVAVAISNLLRDVSPDLIELEQLKQMTEENNDGNMVEEEPPKPLRYPKRF